MADQGQIVEGVNPTPSTVFKCRSQRLVKLISKLNDAQREGVKRIGFGGLLELRCKKFPLDHAHLFVEAFNDRSYVFRASDFKEFRLTKHDVHDCFLLPLGPKTLDLVPTGRKKLSSELLNKELKARWRKKYNVTSASQYIPLNKLYDDIEASKDGGDEFLRLFVLVSMSEFLAPTSNGVDLKILSAVEDVSAISQYDWCSYVLDGIVTAAFESRKQKTCLRGCIPFLMISYFQRFDFGGQILKHDIPLIKHWDKESITTRLEGELVGGSLGRLTWSSARYPRCLDPSYKPNVITGTDAPKLLITDTATPQLLITGPSPSHSNNDKKFIQIELPPGVEDDQELQARAVDVSSYQSFCNSNLSFSNPY